jgi:hypothetical protein
MTIVLAVIGLIVVSFFVIRGVMSVFMNADWEKLLADYKALEKKYEELEQKMASKAAKSELDNSYADPILSPKPADKTA